MILVNVPETLTALSNCNDHVVRLGKILPVGITESSKGRGGSTASKKHALKWLSYPNPTVN